MDSHTPELAKRLDALRARAAALGFLGASFDSAKEDNGLPTARKLPSGFWTVASNAIALIFIERPTPKQHAEAQLLLVETEPVASFLRFRASCDGGRTFTNDLILYSPALFVALGPVAFVPRKDESADAIRKPEATSRREHRRQMRVMRREARRELDAWIKQADG